MTTPPFIKLDRGIHVMHLFYRVDRERWSRLQPGAATQARARLEELCAANANPSHPRVATYAGVGGKSDLAFILYAADLVELGRLHRELEACFPPKTLRPVYSYLSVTELTEYMPTEEESRQNIIQQDKLEPGTPEFEARLAEASKRRQEYEHFRLYPEMPDWEVMCFYPMNKRRDGGDNWYMLDFTTRKRLMAGHARVGRKFSGRISQLITGSAGLDDWEWGVTLMAHQLDAVKEIVYQMRFDEVSARYGDFGPFYLNLRLQPDALWAHLGL
ncbi:MAG TPA: hydrogen peroxide-dependent heme synthase [Candidatus Saccharimonadales bacterium]|jgi:chlorite dismutase|nr:hydrogen peroxide-dependent heme synthase [Candidatus Saccharimonadales bacterium]